MRSPTTPYKVQINCQVNISRTQIKRGRILINVICCTHIKAGHNRRQFAVHTSRPAIHTNVYSRRQLKSLPRPLFLTALNGDWPKLLRLFVWGKVWRLRCFTVFPRVLKSAQSCLDQCEWRHCSSVVAALLFWEDWRREKVLEWSVGGWTLDREDITGIIAIVIIMDTCVRSFVASSCGFAEME